VDIDLIGKSVEFKFDLDTCSNYLHVSIENLIFDIPLLTDYQWGKYDILI